MKESTLYDGKIVKSYRGVWNKMQSNRISQSVTLIDHKRGIKFVWNNLKNLKWKEKTRGSERMKIFPSTPVGYYYKC